MSDRGRLIVHEETSARAVIVSVSGNIDSYNAETFTKRLKTAIGYDTGRVVVDLGEVTYMTSAGFRSLLVGAKEAKVNGCEFTICNVTGKVYELFDISGLFELFSVHPDRDTALAA
jgi:anti-anti-sigma factor